ncbi:MAG: hypothetical protein KDE51_08490 [Anaerolineales bacterium]|nr:hypothetical protein [Anaerolineales bacterium]
MSDHKPTPISIWEPQTDAHGRLVFVRPEPLVLGDHYADRRVIPAPKTAGVTRICFLGESAAAGYLYAPHITPAKVLSHHLNTAAEGQTFEVIDLARTNERLETLLETAAAARQLKPDLLVVFTGNNWNLLETPHISPYFPSLNGRRAFAAALREQGLLGPMELAARQLMDDVGAAFARLHTITQAAGIPLILVIPEVNLADWETRQPAPWLGAAESERWYQLYGAAVEAITQSDWETLFQTADEMLTLDGEQCPTSWRLLALAHQGLGNKEQARLAAEMEISKTQYATLGFLGAPQISVLGQELQRRAAAFYGFRVVDLPRLLPQMTAEPLSGRDLFADYCHLTAEGMHQTLAAVAAEILQRPWAELLPQLTPFPVTSTALATARFGAAIHTAHRQLPVNPHHDGVHYWCVQALAADPAVVEAMLDYVEARCVPLPAVLTAAQQRNAASPFRLEHQHGWRYDYLDALLLEALGKVLAEHKPAAYKKMVDLLLKWRAVGDKAVDLLADCFYLWEPLARFYPETGRYADLTEYAYVRAPWPESSLAVVTEATADVAVRVTGRLPHFEDLLPKRAGIIKLVLNGSFIGQAIFKQRWQTVEFVLPQPQLKRGLNKLTLQWPPLPDVDGLAQAVTRLERGEAADLYPVFGELFAVKVWLTAA